MIGPITRPGLASVCLLALLLGCDAKAQDEPSIQAARAAEEGVVDHDEPNSEEGAEGVAEEEALEAAEAAAAAEHAQSQAETEGAAGEGGGAQPNGATEGEAAPSAEGEDGASTSRSTGYTNRGRLRDGVLLQEGTSLRFKGGSPRERHGTQELVDMIRTAADAVAAAMPNRRLAVGDLSGPRGGRISPHRSHQSGRDADLGFYLLNSEGNQPELNRFVDVNRNGVGRHRDERYTFDKAANWLLVKALLNSPHAQIQYLIIARPLRRLLIEYAEEQGQPAELVDRAKVALYTGSSSPHTNHFHIRIYCPVNDLPRCRDDRPLHPWYQGPAWNDEARATPDPPPRRLSRRARRRARRARRNRTRMRSSMMRTRMRSSMSRSRMRSSMSRTRMRSSMRTRRSMR